MFEPIHGTHARFLDPYGSNQPQDGFWSPSATEIALSIGGTKVWSAKGATDALARSPRCWHTGGTPVKASTDGTDSTPVVTETYIAEIELPAAKIIGIALFQGSVAAGNCFLILYDASGAVVAQSVSTAVVGTDAFQRVPFVTPYVSPGGTFYVGAQYNNTSNRFNTHPVGNFGAGKKTGEVFATPTSIAALPPPTTFTAGQGPMASAY